MNDVLFNTTMSFKHTALWKAAFETSRIDATPEEQTRLAGCYDAMRVRTSMLVAKIASDLPHMTVHDVKHSTPYGRWRSSPPARMSSSTPLRPSCSGAQSYYTTRR
jgi:hypothetical protein